MSTRKMYWPKQNQKMDSLKRLSLGFWTSALFNVSERIHLDPVWGTTRPVEDTFEKYLDTDTFKILSEKSI